MNSGNIAFLESHNINMDEVMNKVDCKVYDASSINPIIDTHRHDKTSSTQRISIANIIGFTPMESIPSNIFLGLDSYFDSDSNDGYHTRSLSMQEYSSDDIVDGLSSSFEIEPITIRSIDNGKYIVEGNGLHRYHLLRVLYLDQISKALGNDEEIKKINEKFTIPADTTEIDYTKTYCDYILSNIQTDLSISSEERIKKIKTNYDEDYQRTDSSAIIFDDGHKEIMNDEQLIKYTKEKMHERLSECPEFFQDNLPKECSKHKSLKEFCLEYFPDIDIIGRGDRDFD